MAPYSEAGGNAGREGPGQNGNLSFLTIIEPGPICDFSSRSIQIKFSFSALWISFPINTLIAGQPLGEHRIHKMFYLRPTVTLPRKGDISPL